MSRIAFISGHRDITEDEFIEHYSTQILAAIHDGDSFVVGDYYGVDIMAQRFLELEGMKHKLTVYHMFTTPRNCVSGVKTVGGFVSDEERDSSMTANSNYDIAWVREGKEKSGTAQNLDRRIKFNKEMSN